MFSIFAFLSSSPSAWGGEDGGLECLRDLEVPVYAGIMWRSGFIGTAKASFELAADGTVAKVTVVSPFVALSQILEGQLRKATFLPGCSGRTMKLDFIYNLLGPPAESPDNTIRVQGPRTFIITAHPQKPLI